MAYRIIVSQRGPAGLSAAQQAHAEGIIELPTAGALVAYLEAVGQATVEPLVTAAAAPFVNAAAGSATAAAGSANAAGIARAGAETAKAGADTAKAGADAAKTGADTAKAGADAAAAVAAAAALEAQGNAAIAVTNLSPYVNALRLGREASAGSADVVASSTFFQQPIATTGTNKWRGMVRANGLLFSIPFDADTLLVHNPDTGKMWRYTAAQLGLPTAAFSGGQKWNRAVVGRDGLIYCIPYDATAVLIIDPVKITATLTTFGLSDSSLSGGDKWDGGAIDANGVIWCAPYASALVLAINTLNGSARTYNATQLGLALATSLNGAAKYSGAVCVGGKVYCVPFFENDVLVIDVATGTAAQLDYGLALADTSKWTGAVVIGTLIYCGPANATDILVINTAAGTAVRTAMGADLSGTNKWRTIVAVGRFIYGIPNQSANFLKIDTLDLTGSPQGTATRSNFNCYDVRTPTVVGAVPGGNSDRWGGGVFYKGFIYGCPSGIVAAGVDMLFINTATDQAYYGDGRALWSENKATKWFGGVQHPNGWSVTIPASAQDFLLIKDDDPNDDNPVAVRSTLGLVLNANDQKFQGGALLGDWCIYAMPRSGETNMLKIDLSDTTGSTYGTATLFGANSAYDRETGLTGQPLATWVGTPALGQVDSQAYHSCVVGMDGLLYGIPYNSTKVLIFNRNGVIGSTTNPMFALTNFGLSTAVMNGAAKWVGGALHPNGKIYCGVRGASFCLVIDTNPLSGTYGQAWLTNFGVDLDVASGLVGPANLAMKWSYPKVGADGAIWMGPRKAANLLRIDPGDTSLSPHGRATFETGGLNLSSFAAIDGYSIANKMGSDGKLYMAALEGIGPAGTGPFLVMDTITRKATWETFGLPTGVGAPANTINIGNKCAGVIHTLSGAMIFVPRSGQPAMRLRPKCSPLPRGAILHPMMLAN